MITQLDLDEGHSLSAAQRELGALKALVESPGWKILDAYARQQVENRQTAECRSVPHDIAAFFTREQAIGTVAGIELFRAYPQMLQRDLEHLIVELKSKEPENV